MWSGCHSWATKARHSKKMKSLAHPSYWEFLGHKIVTLFTTDFWVLGLGYYFVVRTMSKWTLTITNQLSAPNICWGFKPILLSSESWVYSPFTHGTSFSLSLCCLLLGSCALMHGSVACRVIFTWHWPWGEVTGRSRSLEGIGSRFLKPCFIT